MVWVRAQLCKLQTGCTRLAAASDKVYQLVAHGRWFSPGTPASSTTKTGRHDIAESGVKTPKFKFYFIVCIPLGNDHLTCRGAGGLWFFVLLRIFFRIFIFFVAQSANFSSRI
jgi:hypothetical protein